MVISFWRQASPKVPWTSSIEVSKTFVPLSKQPCKIRFNNLLFPLCPLWTEWLRDWVGQKFLSTVLRNTFHMKSLYWCHSRLNQGLRHLMFITDEVWIKQIHFVAFKDHERSNLLLSLYHGTGTGMATVTVKRFEGGWVSMDITHFPYTSMIESIFSNISCHIGASIIQSIIDIHKHK